MRRWVFSLYPSPTLLRLSPFCRGPPAHPATSRVLRSHRLHPALLRASRSRFPAVRQFGTEPQPRLSPDPSRNPDLRCTQPLQAPTTRPPVLPPPPSSAAPAHSNHPPARNLQPDYRPESCRLAHSHSPAPTRAEPSRNPDRTPDWSRTSAARSRFRSPRPVRRSSRLHPAAGLYYKRSFIARHPSQPDNDMRSALAALRSRTRALPPPSLPLAAEHEPFLLPRCPSQPSTSPSLLPLVPPPAPPPAPRSGHKKTPARCRAGVGFTENRKNYFSFFSAFSIAAFRAARPAISPRVVFSTEALIFFTVDFVASAAARFSAFSAAISAFLASE